MLPTWETLTQFVNRSGLLLLADLLVFLLVRRGLETLPWEAAAQEVHEDVAEGLQIVSTGLLFSGVTSAAVRPIVDP